MKVFDFRAIFFDYVACLGALEHFIDTEKGIKEMVRVGKRDASFCIMVPNFDYVGWRRGSRGTSQQEINENLFTLREWRRILDNSVLVVCKVYRDDWAIRSARVFCTFNPLKFLSYVIFHTLPLKYTYQFAFICRKRSTL